MSRQQPPAALDLGLTPPHPPFFSSPQKTASEPSSDSEPPSPTIPSSQPHSQPGTPRSIAFRTPAVHREANPFASPMGSPLSTPANLPGSGPSTPPPQASNQNPFSPPASVRSFSALAGTAPTTPDNGAYSNAGAYPFTLNASAGSSMIDVPSRGSFASNDMPRPFSTYSIGERASFSRPNSSSGNLPGPMRREAFASPPSRPLTISATPSTARLRSNRPKSTAFLVPSVSINPDTFVVDEKTGKKKSTRAAKGAKPTLNGALDKPWIGLRDTRSSIAYWLTYATVFLGAIFGFVRIYTVYLTTQKTLLTMPLCQVLNEDFTGKTTEQLFGTGVAGEGGVFFREVDASGFGNGEFEMTTASDANSFIRDGQLYLVPTLTSDVIPMSSILDGAIYNLTDCTYNITHSSGYTTSGHGSTGINTTEGTNSDGTIAPDAPLDLQAYLAACSAYSNATLGKILPPVMSARISTRRTASLRYGRVEVVAKLPTGDWLWPAIWMLPVDNVYGGWPLSGEIDIIEARGNAPSYPHQGIDTVRSSLNWGPTTFLNSVALTFGWKTQRRGRFDDGFHLYALEWVDGFMRFYVDSRLTHIYQINIDQTFWDRGHFPTVVQNGTASVVLENPWVNGTYDAPFDQKFYLIMNVAVGGTNGWFPDGPEKPWLDGSATAPLDFLRAQDKWYPTWPKTEWGRGMVIDSVKMWEICG